MRRYNNQDYSMLTTMTAVENILKDIKSWENILAVNVEDQYLE